MRVRAFDVIADCLTLDELKTCLPGDAHLDTVFPKLPGHDVTTYYFTSSEFKDISCSLDFPRHVIIGVRRGVHAEGLVEV